MNKMSAMSAIISIAVIMNINPLSITAISPEDGSGHRWLFTYGPVQYYADIVTKVVKVIAQ